MKTVLRSLAGAVAAIVGIGQAGRFHPALDLANAFLAPLLILLIVLLVLAVRSNDRPTALVTAVAAALATIQLLSPVGPLRAQELGKTELRLLTQSTWRDNEDPELLLRLIETQAPDIAVLQETNGTASHVVARVLPGYHRIGSCSQTTCSLTIISRWPLRRIRPRATVGPLADLLITEIDAPFGSFRLINVHLPRPNRGRAVPFQAQLLAEIETSEGRPLIVAGDFNYPTGSFAFAEFARASGLTAVEGFRPTYPAHVPFPAFIGIDHVFVSDDWTAGACRTARGAGSDHHGVVCAFRMNRDPAGD